MSKLTQELAKLTSASGWEVVKAVKLMRDIALNHEARLEKLEERHGLEETKRVENTPK